MTPEKLVHVLIASSEFDPLVKVGGLGEATAGLAACLRQLGLCVDVVVPDYPVSVEHESEWTVDLPSWAGGTGRVRSAPLAGVGAIHAVSVDGIQRPHPYVDPHTNQGWHDNDRRFFAFSSAVAAVATKLDVDVLLLNDWHTALAAAWFPPERCVLTIHNLAHQGQADIGWLQVLGDRAASFEHLGDCNPLAGAIRLAHKLVTVSPGYAREMLSPEFGCGLEGELASRAVDLVGIRNGLDPAVWGPAVDRLLPANYSSTDMHGKATCRAKLREMTGLSDAAGPTIGMVSRFADQKGIDLVLDLIAYLPTVPASIVIHGTGDSSLVEQAQEVATRSRSLVRVLHGYDEEFAHLVVAGSDLIFVPSRFEPCGLTQMQAMTCGTIPVVTAVGGLADTVVDTDRDPSRGTGFVAERPSVPALVDALHRGARGWRHYRRRTAVQKRGMEADWSWRQPGLQYVQLLEATAHAA